MCVRTSPYDLPPSRRSFVFTREIKRTIAVNVWRTTKCDEQVNVDTTARVYARRRDGFRDRITMYKHYYAAPTQRSEIARDRSLFVSVRGFPETRLLFPVVAEGRLTLRDNN